jgi:uncharacterized protein (TIGR02145 family)
MKKPLFFVFTLMVTISACSKKSNAPVTPTIVYINGADYPIVVIGNQTWTASNYDGAGGEVFDNNIDTPANGKLYTIAEAEAIPLPNGWRLPNEQDLMNLLAAQGVTEPFAGTDLLNPAHGAPVKALMSTTGWINGNGTNSSGFNALPVGFYGMGYNTQQSFQWQATNAVFITTATNGSIPLSFNIYQYNPAGLNNIAYLTNILVLPTDRGSVRFVKDN